MCLQGQGFVGGQDLDQEWQCVAEVFADRRAELTLGVGGDDVQQGALPVGRLDVRRVGGVGAEPQFGLRVRGGRVAAAGAQNRRRVRPSWSEMAAARGSSS